MLPIHFAACRALPIMPTLTSAKPAAFADRLETGHVARLVCFVAVGAGFHHTTLAINSSTGAFR